MCKHYGVDQSTTTPYNPQGNAQTERFNQTLIQMLKSLEPESKLDWPRFLASVVFAYNCTPHSVTGLQPYELMFGRSVPTLCDRWLGLGDFASDKDPDQLPNLWFQ